MVPQLPPVGGGGFELPATLSVAVSGSVCELFVTVQVALCWPAVVNACVTVWPLAVPPSSKCHEYVVEQVGLNPQYETVNDSCSPVLQLTPSLQPETGPE